MQLPADLRIALETELQQASSRDVARAARELSQRYRAGHSHSSVFLHSPLDAVAYVAYRLPATYAAIRAVLGEVRDRRPDLAPKTLLDVGAGPGTASWAAADSWPGLERITLLERDSHMIRIGKALAARSDSAAIRDAVWRQVDVTAPWQCGAADVTIAAYMIGELPEQTWADFLRRLWEGSSDTCIIVEPGTPRGFNLIRQAGNQLVSAGAHILAPFPQNWDCLESTDDWCHFVQRVPRTRLQRAVKEAALAYEDEKYSYVAASRVPGLPIAARVIRHPQVRSGHIRLVLCTAEGVKHMVVTRSNREAFRRARDLAWGSAIALEEADLFGLSCDTI